MTQKHFITLLHYISIGFIAGSISHGFFSLERSGIMALVGMILFVIAQLLEKKYVDETLHNTASEYAQIAVIGLLFSLGVGMISGGLQHFLDSPERSLWIIPVGYILSLLIFPLKEQIHTEKKSKIQRKSLIVWALGGAVVSYGIIYALMHILPATVFHNGDHHDTAENRNMGCDMKNCGDMDCCKDSTNGCTMSGCNMNSSHMMHDEMSISTEEEFIRMMIPHHQEAVDTSSRLAAITQNPELKDLTTAIVQGQTKEIAMMEGRLTQRYPNGHLHMPYMPMMRDTSTISAITTIEKMWLEDMIGHHQGAVDMAQSVLTLNPRPEVAQFAQAVIDLQSSEIAQMKKMLKQYK